MLRIYHGNRLETLLDRLNEVCGTPLADPLAPELIITQHAGMTRWLSQQLAFRRGIAANLDFPLPSAFIWRLLREQDADLPQESPFDKLVLVWRIFSCLPECLEQAGFEPLRHYLNEDAGEFKRYQLAGQLADVFDQYLVYRPQWLLGWERGEDEHWQAQLWRRLVEKSGGRHRARLLTDFLARCKRGAWASCKLPERISVFGINTLPPIYLEVLAQLARIRDVHLFVLNPCLEYWGDLVSSRDQARLQAYWQRKGKQDASEYFPALNEILASQGRLGREYQDLLQRYATEAEEQMCFDAPDTSTLLGCLQTDLLLLSEGQSPRVSVPVADHSLQIHACHSPLREVQILHDQLLACFEAAPDLRPADIAVMCPNLERYAPFIEAVFGAASGNCYIPWAISDRSPRQEHPLLQAFLQLLQLPGSRFGVTDVLALLEVPAVLRRFGLDVEGLACVRQWVQESGVRWGRDPAARAALGLPALRDHTWQFGLERMYLGYAMHPEDSLFMERHPYTVIEGAQARHLGSLSSFIEALDSYRVLLDDELKPAQWVALFNRLLDSFFVADEEEGPLLQAIRDAMDAWLEGTQRAGFDAPLGLGVVRDALQDALRDPGARARFLAGQVNFCGMVPMRSIPFRVLCLIGLNDGDYPRMQRRPGFDLMAMRPEPGDRSLREDDRYLFLECLLSARERLYLSYVGRNQRDNSPMLPSVLVSELLDYLEAGYIGEHGRISDQLITEHPLQPFSYRYYDKADGLFSYAGEWLPVQPEAAGEPPFIEQPLGMPEPDRRQVDLADLIRFFRNPAKFFLKERLGIHLDEFERAPTDAEPFELDGLPRYQLQSEMLEHALAGNDLESYLPVLQAQGSLPCGAFGLMSYREQRESIERFARERIAPLLTGPCEPREIKLKLGEFHLHGWLRDLQPDGLLSYRPAKVKASDYIGLWIRHLALCAISREAAPTSIHIGTDTVVRFAPVDDAAAQLEQFLEGYWQGLCEPLAFFPQCSHAYANALAGGKSVEEAKASAAKAWESTAYQAGDGDIPEARIAWRGRNPLGPQFESWASKLLKPLCEQLQKKRS